MNVLSLFDGMGCGRLAFDRAKIPVSNYFASEINKPSIKVAKRHYPDINELGDVRGVTGAQLPKIDFVCAGSPCQGFSSAGKLLNFADPRSMLFFEFVRILEEVRAINPEVVFLLENVNMKKEWAVIITDILKVEPVLIDSNLVSAQNRERLYWTNIKAVPYTLFGNYKSLIKGPEDRNILLPQILESQVPDRFFLKKKSIENGFKLKDGLDLDLLPDIGVVKFGRTDEAKEIRRENIKNGKDYTPFQAKEIVNIDANKMNCITASSAKDNILFIRRRSRGKASAKDSFDKSPTVTSNSWQNNHVLTDGYSFRRLMPVEVERLQTVPDNYTDCVPETHRYEMLGNGWTIDAIVHILNQWKN